MERSVVFLRNLNGVPTANALARSLKVLKYTRRVVSAQSTSVFASATDVFLVLRDLNRRVGKRHHLVVYPKTKNDPGAGFARPSVLLTFLLTEREAGYPCIIDAGVRCTTCTERLSRVSPLTAVADTIRIASGDYAPTGRGPEVTPPALDRANVDSLRSLVLHWIQRRGGLDLARLLNRGFGAFEDAFEGWSGGGWHDRHHWRSFYALCLWFSHLPDPLPSRNGVQPGNACWKQWSRLLDSLYEGRPSEAADLFDENWQALNRCLRWI